MVDKDNSRFAYQLARKKKMKEISLFLVYKISLFFN